MTAAAGNTVRVHYRGTLDDGTEFDSSAGRDPLEFTIGSGQVIAGFDNAVTGMSEGETKTVTIPAAEAHGEATPAMVHEVPRSDISANIPLEVGFQLAASDETVTLDANHALAGKALTFELTLASIAS